MGSRDMASANFVLISPNKYPGPLEKNNFEKPQRHFTELKVACGHVSKYGFRDSSGWLKGSPKGRPSIFMAPYMGWS